MGTKVEQHYGALRGVFRTSPELMQRKPNKPLVAKGILFVGNDTPGAEEMPVTFKPSVAVEASVIPPGRQVILHGTRSWENTEVAENRLKATNTHMEVDHFRMEHVYK